MLVLSLDDPALVGAGWSALAVGASVALNWFTWGRQGRAAALDALLSEGKLLQDEAATRAAALGAALETWQQQVMQSVAAGEDQAQNGMLTLNQNQQVLLEKVQEIGNLADQLVAVVNPQVDEREAMTIWRRQIEAAVMELSARADKQAQIMVELTQLQQQALDPRADQLSDLTGRLESVQQEFLSRQAARNGTGGQAGQGRPVRAPLNSPGGPGNSMGTPPRPQPRG